MEFATRFGRSLIVKRHESCKNHELRQSVNFDKDENKCPYEIHIKCLKGHNWLETSANTCEDYELTTEDFGWKLGILQQLVKDYD